MWNWIKEFWIVKKINLYFRRNRNDFRNDDFGYKELYTPSKEYTTIRINDLEIPKKQIKPYLSAIITSFVVLCVYCVFILFSPKSDAGSDKNKVAEKSQVSDNGQISKSTDSATLNPVIDPTKEGSPKSSEKSTPLALPTASGNTKLNSSVIPIPSVTASEVTLITPTTTATPITPTNEVTISTSPTLAPVPTVKPSPTMPMPIKLLFQEYNGNTTILKNTVYPRIKVVNNGSDPINLADIKIRYYFTTDGNQHQTFWCDYSALSSSDHYLELTSRVISSFTKISPAKNNADCQLEIGFSNGTVILNPGATVEIRGRFAKDDWSNYNQGNDYSFNANATSYTQWNKITAYISGQLVSGVSPAP